MSISLQDVPYPLAQTMECDIPREISNFRAQIDPKNLSNSANVLHDYIDELANLVYSRSRYTSFQEMIEASKRIVVFRSLKTSPWVNYEPSNTIWTVFDELIASVYSLSLIYILLTVEMLDATLGMTRIGLENWQRCNNYLKMSYGYLTAFKNDIASSQQGYFNKALSLSDFYIQLVVILKNIWDVQSEIVTNLGRLDEVPKNVTTFIKILVFMNNQLQVIEPGANIAWKKALQIFLCYYSSLKAWDENKIGLANGYIRCGLVLALEQGEVRGKLKDGLKKLHIVKKKERETVRDKELFMADIKLERSFRNVPLLEESLEAVVKLLRSLYIKFGKINDTLAFEEVPSSDSIKQSFLFTSKDIPNGLQVPLTNYTVYKPVSLQNSSNVNMEDKYF